LTCFIYNIDFHNITFPPGLALASQLEQLLVNPSQKQTTQQGGDSVVEKWFQLTRIAGQTNKATTRDQPQGQGQGQGVVAGSTLESVCRMEITANTIILQQHQQQ